MVRIALRGLSILVLAGILAACGDDDSSSPTEPGGDDRLQMPLTVGNRWVQRVVVTAGGAFYVDTESSDNAFHVDTESWGTESSGAALRRDVLPPFAGIDLSRAWHTRSAGGADTVTVWSTLTGTEERHGAIFFVQTDSSESGVSTSYLRQSANELFTEFEIAPPVDDTIVRRIVGLVEATMPWKLAQFGVPSGTEWRLASVDTTLIHQGSAYDVRFDIVGSSRGVSPVTVPAGSWPEAQVFRLHVSGSVGIVGFPPASQSSYQDVWIVDGVGVVKQHNVDSFDPGQGAFTIQSIGELTEYQVQTARP